MSALEARGPSGYLTDEKAAAATELPTISEASLPAGAPRALADRLHGAIDATIRSPARPS